MTMLGPAAFVGQWRLQRTITDRLGGQTGRLVGQAVFTQAGQGVLAYQETGDLRIGDGPVMVAMRRYLWVFDAGGVAVQFGDGAAFHRFIPTGHAAGTDHPCGDDLYRVEYDFTRWPIWRATWVVHGPRKDYTSVSDYGP
ncbi:DUF6314 family protein [Yoonia sp.]|uniref:DUF6314 family protein n=1 Tax=Yoonia sp. TaxID=2212373 RepID=UPI003F6B433D